MADSHGKRYQVDFVMQQQGKVRDRSHGLDHQDWRRRSQADKLLCDDIMKLLDVVALLEPIPEQHLLRGQVGTVVEELDPGYVEVEFLVGDDYITLV